MSPGAEGVNAARVRRLIEALRDQDLDAFVALLDPEVELEAQKGSFRGRDEVRRWATVSADGQLYSRVQLDELREIGDHVAADARRQWRWRDGDELAEESKFAYLFELRDGKVLRWRQRFDSIVDAIEAIPVGQRDHSF